MNRSLFLALTLLVGGVLEAEPQRRGERGQRGERGAVGPVEVHEAPREPGIAWFGSWESALAEARRTGRPILFQSAAPQCQSVPGVW